MFMCLCYQLCTYVHIYIHTVHTHTHINTCNLLTLMLQVCARLSINYTPHSGHILFRARAFALATPPPAQSKVIELSRISFIEKFQCHGKMATTTAEAQQQHNNNNSTCLHSHCNYARTLWVCEGNGDNIRSCVPHTHTHRETADALPIGLFITLSCSASRSLVLCLSRSLNVLCLSVVVMRTARSVGREVLLLQKVLVRWSYCCWHHQRGV